MTKKEYADLCLKKCTAKCCTGISIPTDRPRTKDEIEELRFYMVHKNVEIYIRDRRWYINLMEKCRYLNRKNLCTQYETRPLICRKHSSRECEYWGDYYDVLFTNEKEMLDYLAPKKRKGVKKGQSRHKK